jgi:hypothetical protein
VDAGYPAAAASLEHALLASALDAVQAHVEQEGDLRAHAITQGLLVASRFRPPPVDRSSWARHASAGSPVRALWAAPVIQ